ncbi:membrane protein [Microbacterium phage Cece]|nr:membrane protein [Microbacterium phage Cece]UVG35339.1 membrane protein [Microbacterium phage Cece]
MELAIFVGLGAFVLIGVMIALLALSSRGESDDPVTQEIIVRASTGPVIVNAPVKVEVTQEEEH